MTEPRFSLDEGGPRVYQALVIKKGLEALQKGFKLNTAYNSTNLRLSAQNFTGKRYPAGKRGIQSAIDDLQNLLDAHERKAQQGTEEHL